MNCKQGDTAIVIKGKNSGKVLTCVRLTPKIEVSLALKCKGFWYTSEIPEEIYWEVDTPIVWGDGVMDESINYIADSFLRPIKDSNGEDEMVKLLGKPNDMIVA